MVARLFYIAIKMKKLFLNGMFLLMAVMASAGFVSCDSDSDSANRDHDASLYGEWVESNGTQHEYWCDGSSLEITRNGRTKYYYEK